MIYSIGEILADMIEQNNVYECFVGGAPFNVAYVVNKLGGNVCFIGNVGNDVIGKFLIQSVKEFGMDVSLITQDDYHNTTLAFVKNDKNGERSFSFFRNETADYYINEQIANNLEEADIVHIGSLMLSEEYGRKLAHQIFQEAKKANKIISFDINYRSDIYESEEDAINIYREFIAYADIIKTGEDEIRILSREKDIDKGFKMLFQEQQKVFITLGKNGSKLICGDKEYCEKSIEIKPVDTTGAGDAFYGSILKYIDEVGFNKFFFDETIIRNSLKKANIVGAHATLKKGAISNILSASELEKEFTKNGYK